MPHIPFIWQVVHLVGRVAFRDRTLRRNVAPAVRETAGPQVVQIPLGQRADAQLSVGVDGEGA